MIIKVDKEGQKFLTELADLALKGAGLMALEKVNMLGRVLSPIEDKPKSPDMVVVKDDKIPQRPVKEVELVEEGKQMANVVKEEVKK